MYNRGFSAESLRDPLQRLDTELESGTAQLEKSASLAGQIDDVTLAQAELDATPADSGLASLLTTTGGDALVVTGGALTEYNPQGSGGKEGDHHFTPPW